MAAWQSMFPTLSEEWPSPQFAGDEDSPPPARNTGKGTLDFGSMVIRDTLVERVPISRPSSRNSSNPGTLVVKGTTSGSMIQRQGGNEGLAWAAALMQNKDLLSGQEADSLKQSIAPSATPSNQPVPNSPHKLLSIFDPPPATKPGTGKHRVPVLEPLLEESSEAERQDQQSHDQPTDFIDDTTKVQAQEELHREFTFSCPRERTSWKSLPHFGQQPAVASPKQSPTVSPRHPFTNRSFGQSGQRSTPTSSGQTSPSPQLKPTPAQEKPLSLFQFTYDTYTRDRLEALVEEIDSLQTIPRNASDPQAGPDDEQRWEGLSEEPDSDEERPIYRSSKRIRLSPSNERPMSRVPSTPRSAVRDRIRERRSMPQFQEPSTPLPAHRPAFSLPSASINPTQPQAHPVPTSTQLPVPIYLQPETPRAPSSTSRPASANPVKDRLQEAQALMNRIKQQPRASVSSFEASSSAASASVNRRSDESRDTPEYEEASDAQQQPRGHLGPSDYRTVPGAQSGISTMNLGPPRFDFKPASRASTQSGTSGSGTIKQNGTISSRGTISTRLTSSYGFNAKEQEQQISSSLFPPAANQRVPSSSSVQSNGWSNNLKSGFDSSSIAHSSRSNQQSQSSYSNQQSQSSRNAQSQASSRSHQSNQSQHTKGLTTIAPEDIQHLLAPVQGKMVFDPQEQRWVKTSQLSRSEKAVVEGEEEVEHSSDDVFKDIESFASRPGSAAGVSPVGQVEAQSPGQVGESSFRQQYEADGSEDGQVSFDHEEQPEEQASDQEEQQNDGIEEYLDDTLEMPEEEAELEDQGPLQLFEAVNQLSQQSMTPPDSPIEEQPEAEISFVQPTAPAPPAESPYISTFNGKSSQTRAFSDPLSTPAGIRPDFRPRSVLKTRSDPMLSTPQDRNDSPAGYKSRSVSFSDGRIAGKMQGVPIRVVSPEGEEIVSGRRGSGLKYEVQAEGETHSEPEASPAPSASATASVRTKRIENALADLNDIDEKSTSTLSAGNETTIVSNARSKRSRPRTASFIKTRDPFRSSGSIANATFLTECSFGVSQDKLVQLITDVEPYEPCWEELRTVDLSHKGAESLVRLKEFLPSLDEADLSHNEITYLTGVPTTIRTLLMSSNRLTSLTSFGHLRNLERLDISSNQLDSVAQLTCLVHLRELNVDNNRISSIDGLSQLDGLIKISMKNNRLSSINFGRTKWRRLESLNLSHNQLVDVSSLDCLESCVSLNLDNNSIRTIGGSRRMPRLRILRICDNPLESIELACFCGLRTLLLDNAYLSTIANLDHLKKLENFSIRNQKGHRIQLQSRNLRDLRRLYFSGNKLPRSFPANQYYNLVYLELAMCQLSALPEGFASLIPNCRSLNLNHNFLEDLSPLADLARLRRLTLVGSRIQEASSLADVIGRLPELEVLDLRMNPLTLAFYPPLTYSLDLQKGDGGFAYSWPDSRLSAPSEKDASAWRLCDTQFKKVLPDRWYLRRTAYRGALMQANACLKTIDGLDVETGADRSEILELLKHMPAKLRE